MQLRLNEWRPGSPASAGLPGLRENEIQLWTACVPARDEELAEFNLHLGPAEHERARRFSNPAARREFVFARACLRMLLGGCLQVDPATLDFGTRARGKPCLRRSTSAPDLRFNLSHSGGRVLVALALSREVGVDLEWIPGLEDWLSLASRILSPRELAELHSLPPARQPAAFFNGWTRKEAWLKATGVGLMDALPAIEVTLAPGRPAEWLALPGGPDEMRQWTIQDLPLPPEFAGALVYENTKPLRSSGV